MKLPRRLSLAGRVAAAVVLTTLVAVGVTATLSVWLSPWISFALAAVVVTPLALWIGRRDGPSGILPKDPSLLVPGAARYAHLPGGHQEAWADAFCNVMRDIYGFIADGKPPSAAHPPAFATFEDGYRANCVVEAILKSAKAGAWTKVDY